MVSFLRKEKEKKRLGAEGGAEGVGWGAFSCGIQTGQNKFILNSLILEARTPGTSFRMDFSTIVQLCMSKLNFTLLLNSASETEMSQF